MVSEWEQVSSKNSYINSVPGNEVIKLFFVLTSDQHEIFSANKYENANKNDIFIYYLKRKNLQLLVIFKFISRTIFMLSWARKT